IREFDFGNKAKDFLADHTEPKVIDEIRNYILLGETDAQKKARYADIMPLIPEKITKNKLFNKIENFTKIFEGDFQSFESFAYKCRTAALAKSVDEKVQDAGIEAGLAKLREIDFDDFTEGDCEAAFLMAKKLIDDVDYVIDALYSSQEMINNIYAYSLLRRYVDANNLQGDKGLLTEEVIKYFTGTIDEEQPDDKFTDKMDRMFEDLVSDVSELHGISEVLMENAKRCGVDSDLVKSISGIIDIEKLFSSSVYAELEGDGDGAVSGDIVAMTGELINELDECLSQAPTSIRKILIKNINALMPASVDFSSSLEEYVMLNLFTARSDSERAFYVSEILEVIQSEKKEGDISDFLV
ncbi:MAG: hypothetical protein K6G63_01965, partial [Eubacterium sp.]|nr:hypothetical protein [Eubacterium sp.]